jgi:hypothetical protein
MKILSKGTMDLHHKYLARVEVTESDKHSSLLHYAIIYYCEKL